MITYKLRALLFYTVLLAGMMLVPGGAALAKHRDTAVVIPPQDALTEATVNLYCRFKAGKKLFSTSGSGVFIGGSGIVLTNAHVAQFFLLQQGEGRAKGWCGVRTGSPAKEHYTAEVLYLPKSWVTENSTEFSKSVPKGTGMGDYALLQVTGTKQGVLPLLFPTLPLHIVEPSAREDEAVRVAGYPSEGMKFDAIRNKLAQVVATSSVTGIKSFSDGVAADQLTIAPSAAGRGGISGGPVASTEGAVVAIVATKSNGKGDRTLQAITIPYIGRSLFTTTGVSLTSALLLPSLLRTHTTNAASSTEMRALIEKGLLKKK